MTAIVSIDWFILVARRDMNEDNSCLVSAYMWPSLILRKICRKVILASDFIYVFITLRQKDYDLCQGNQLQSNMLNVEIFHPPLIKFMIFHQKVRYLKVA